MNFAYRAFDAKGAASSGTIEAADVHEATEKLRQKGLFISECKAAGGSSTPAPAAAPKARGLHPGKGKLKNLAVFTRQLAVLVGAGTPVADALSALEKQAPEGPWRKILADVCQRVEQGEALSDAVAAHPRAFDSVARSLIAAGEASGNMQGMLERLAVLARRRQHVRGSIIGAMVYPTLLICTSLCVIVALLTSVLPRFTQMFEALDAPLPASTKFLMAAGDWLRAQWYIPLGAAAGIVVSLTMWVRSSAGRRQFDALASRLPVVGKIVRSFCVAQVARILGTLIDSKVPLLEAIALTRQASSSAVYRDLLTRAEDAVTRGEPISKTLQSSPLIPASLAEAVRSGETSGNVGTVLTHIAGFIEEDNEVIVRSLTSILEPAILIVLGGIVAFVAISMFLPMFDLAASAGGGGKP